MRAWLVLLSSALAGCSTPTAPDAGTLEPRPCLTLPPSLEFGEWRKGDVANLAVPLRNDSNTWLTVRAVPFPPFSGGLERTPVPVPEPTLNLGPGERASVALRFLVPDSRLHLGKLEFNGGGAHCEDQLIELRVLGIGGLEAPEQLEFPAIDAGTRVTRPLTVINASRAPLTLGASMLNDPSFDGGSSGAFEFGASFTIGANSSLDVPITFVATGNGGVRGLLLLDAPPFTRSVFLFASAGVPRLTLQPASLTLEALPVGDPQTWTIRPVNAGEGVGRLRLAQVLGSATSPAEEVTGPSEPGDEIRVTFAPRSLGPRQWTLQFETNDPARPLIDVPVTGLAVPPLFCRVEVQVDPNFFELDGGVPARVRASVLNPNPIPCFVKAEPFGDFDAQLDDDQFFIDAGQRLPFEFTVNSPRSGVVLLTTSSTLPQTSIQVVVP